MRCPNRRHGALAALAQLSAVTHANCLTDSQFTMLQDFSDRVRKNTSDYADQIRGERALSR
jgi:hypothetical protein